MKKVNGYYVMVGFKRKVFLNKALALDESEYGITECTIMAENIYDGMMLYADLDDLTAEEITWYGTEAMAWKAVEEKNPNAYDPDVVTAVLSTQKVDPLPRYFQVDLHETVDGRFMTIFNPHPETSGVNGKGKIFFPDRSWKGILCEGTATVRITKEFEKYGFVVGKMDDFQPVEAETVVEWIRRCHVEEFLQRRALLVEGALGEYFVISEHGAWQAIQPVSPEFPDYLGLNKIAAERLEQDTIKRRGLLFELLFEEIYHKSADNITHYKGNAFFYGSESGKLSISWKREDEDFGSDLIHEAICMNIFSTYRLISSAGRVCENVYAISLNDDKLAGLFDFELEEIEQMMQAASSINSSEEEKIRRLARSGRISVRTPVSLSF